MHSHQFLNSQSPKWTVLIPWRKIPWRKSSHELFILHCSVVSDTCLVWGTRFYFPGLWCWNWKANALADPCIVIDHPLPVPVQSALHQECSAANIASCLCNPPETPGHVSLGTAGYWAALQSAVNALGFQEGGFHLSLNTTVIWTYTESLVQGT